MSDDTIDSTIIDSSAVCWEEPTHYLLWLDGTLYQQWEVVRPSIRDMKWRPVAEAEGEEARAIRSHASEALYRSTQPQEQER